MDISGETAERVVRISMDGVVYALKFSGEGAKALAALIAQAAREENKTSGLMKLQNMLKTGKELKVFILTKEQFERFQKEVKRFGVTYCVLRDKNGGAESPVEIMVKADDSAKVQRIFERLEFANVSTEGIEAEIEKSLEGASPPAPERTESADIGEEAGEEAIKKDGGKQQMPPFSKPDSQSRQSGPTSEGRKGEGKAMRTTNKGRESVRARIIEMRSERQEGPKTERGRDKAQKKKQSGRGQFPIDMKDPARDAKNWNKESR